MSLFGTFDLFRPFFITSIVALIIVLVIVLFQKKRLVNGFSVISIATISLILSAQILFSEGIIVDELNLSGDPVTFNMFLVILGLALLNLVVYEIRRKKLN